MIMARPIREVDINKIALDNILMVMERLTFSKDTSAKIVGGVKKLEFLISCGEIRAEKRQNKQNSKWHCNAADVLRHARCMRRVSDDLKFE